MRTLSIGSVLVRTCAYLCVLVRVLARTLCVLVRTCAYLFPYLRVLCAYSCVSVAYLRVFACIVRTLGIESVFVRTCAYLCVLLRICAYSFAYLCVRTLCVLLRICAYSFAYLCVLCAYFVRTFAYSSRTCVCNPSRASLLKRSFAT